MGITSIQAVSLWGRFFNYWFIRLGGSRPVVALIGCFGGKQHDVSAIVSACSKTDALMTSLRRLVVKAGLRIRI